MAHYSSAAVEAGAVAGTAHSPFSASALGWRRVPQPWHQDLPVGCCQGTVRAAAPDHLCPPRPEGQRPEDPLLHPPEAAGKSGERGGTPTEGCGAHWRRIRGCIGAASTAGSAAAGAGAAGSAYIGAGAAAADVGVEHRTPAVAVAGSGKGWEGSGCHDEARSRCQTCQTCQTSAGAVGAGGWGHTAAPKQRPNSLAPVLRRSFLAADTVAAGGTAGSAADAVLLKAPVGELPRRTVETGVQEREINVK